MSPAKKRPKAKRVDRRVQRTQRLLRTALLELLEARSWDEVTVQDVCDRAEVGRSTFYLHYADKEELLTSGFADLRRHLREQLAARDEPLGFTLAMLEHTTEYDGVARALTGTRTALVVQRAFMDLLIDMVKEDLSRLAPASPLREAAAHYLAGAFSELLRWWGGWGHGRRRAPAIEVDEAFRALTAPILDELRRAQPNARRGG